MGKWKHVEAGLGRVEGRHVEAGTGDMLRQGWGRVGVETC